MYFDPCIIFSYLLPLATLMGSQCFSKVIVSSSFWTQSKPCSCHQTLSLEWTLVLSLLTGL